MKTHTKILTLAFVMAVVLATTVWASESEPNRRRDNGDRIMGDRMLERLTETDPNEAQRLRELRDEDPETFRNEIREVMRAKYQERFGEDGNPDNARLRARHKRRSRRDMAESGRGPDGKGNRAREMIGKKLQSGEKDLIGWLETNDPNTAKELAELKETNRGQYVRRLSLEMKKHRGIIEAQKKNPELARVLTKDLKLRDKRNKLMKQIAETTDEDEKEELTEELEDVISQRFDVLLKKKQIKYEELKERLEELEKQVEKSEEDLDEFRDNKSDYIEERLESLTSSERKFDWK